MKNPFQSIESRFDKIEDLIHGLKSEQHQVVPTNPPETPIHVTEAAQFLGLTVPTIYSKVSKGELPVTKMGKRLYFFRSELLDYLKAGRQKSNTEIEAEAESYLYNTKKD